MPSVRRKPPAAVSLAGSAPRGGPGPDAAAHQDRRDAEAIRAGLARWKRAGRKGKALADVAKDLGLKR